MILFVLSCRKNGLQYYENIQTFINVATQLPTRAANILRATIGCVITESLSLVTLQPGQTVCRSDYTSLISIGVRANIHLGGKTEFCPNGEHKLFVTRPRQGEKMILCYWTAYFLTIVE